jgi:hypothetical protein
MKQKKVNRKKIQQQSSEATRKALLKMLGMSGNLPMETVLHGHPHHVPVEIEIQINVRHRHPQRAELQMTMSGAFLDKSREGQAIDETQVGLTLERLWAQIRPSLMRAILDPGSMPNEEMSSHIYPIEEVADLPKH